MPRQNRQQTWMNYVDVASIDAAIRTLAGECWPVDPWTDRRRLPTGLGSWVE